MLRIDWSINDQYQYGWFVPPIALALFAMRWPGRPAPHPLPGGSAGRNLAWLAAGFLLLLLPIRLLEGPNPDWRLIYWFHASLLLGLSLGALAWSGGRPWVRHFAFPVGFLLLAVPWPSGLEQNIVQGLMRFAANVAAELMNLLAIPAQAQGNLIRVRDQVVGVDEACSGIRSLQTTLMGGCLFGELSRFRVGRRLALLAGGIVFALVANIFRSSLLVWLAANHGVGAIEKYHDLAGVSVLLVSFGGLYALNGWLARGTRGKPGGSPAAPTADAPPAESPVAVPPGRRLPLPFVLAAVGWLALVELGNAAWYHPGKAPPEGAAPRWTVVPRADAPGYQTVRIDDRTARLLRYDRGLAAHWNLPDPARPFAPAETCQLFFFRWEPGHASAAQADMHQPHICLTASGLAMTADHGVQPIGLPGGLSLPVRRYDFVWHGRPVYVFFVVWQDGTGGLAMPGAPSGRWERVRAVIERRVNRGRQTMEMIVAGPTNPTDAAALCARELAGVVRPL